MAPTAADMAASTLQASDSNTINKATIEGIFIRLTNDGVGMEVLAVAISSTLTPTFQHSKFSAMV